MLKHLGEDVSEVRKGWRWFAYSPDRKSEHPGNHLAAFRSRMPADAFPGFNQLYERGVTEIACGAHARRKFHDLYEAHQSPFAKEALERISELYGIEREIRGRPVDERKKIRNERARPRLDDMLKRPTMWPAESTSGSPFGLWIRCRRLLGRSFERSTWLEIARQTGTLKSVQKRLDSPREF